MTQIPCPSTSEFYASVAHIFQTLVEEGAKGGVLGEGADSANTQNRAKKIIDPQMIEQENFGHPVYIGGHHNIK